MVLVDLVFHYGGKWIKEPILLYERKLVHKWEGYDSDLLSYIDITNEYINILGYVGVQQLLVSVPSGKYYEIEDVDVENIIKMLETVVVIDDVSIDCTSDGTENDSDTSNDNSDYNSEELEVLAQERRRHVAGVRVKTLKGEHNKCKDPCGNYKVSATTMAFYFKEKCNDLKELTLVNKRGSGARNGIPRAPLDSGGASKSRMSLGGIFRGPECVSSF
ncbi:hypothetical protein KY284_008319 [Solanum tuberosum]|nr:hypothetical protein KY284_008319 [Solanum tuberosum]